MPTAPEPFKLIDTGQDYPVLFPMIPGQTSRGYTWACLHCQHRDDTVLTFWGAEAAAKDHFYKEHLEPMLRRTAPQSGCLVCGGSRCSAAWCEGYRIPL